MIRRPCRSHAFQGLTFWQWVHLDYSVLILLFLLRDDAVTLLRTVAYSSHSHVLQSTRVHDDLCRVARLLCSPHHLRSAQIRVGVDKVFNPTDPATSLMCSL